MKFTALFILLSLALQHSALAKQVTIEQALDSTKQNNVTWKSLGEYIVQAEKGKRIALGMFLPKLQAEGNWLHMGERNVPEVDFGPLDEIGSVMEQIISTILEEHPEQLANYAPFIDSFASEGGGESTNTFESFVPKSDTFSATFSLFVPVITPESIPAYISAGHRYAAAVQEIGHGREQLLFSVSKTYFGLLTMQHMLKVTDKSIAAAKEHFKSAKLKSSLQSATQLQVKRSELEVAKAESQKVELMANLEKAKAGFRYLTGLQGSFELVEPALDFSPEQHSLEKLLALANSQRKDLIASKIKLEAAKQEVNKVYMKYIPSISLFGQGKFDNAQEQRFDDDPFSWTVGATITANIWDGGIREAQLGLAKSQYRQAKLAYEDLKNQIESEVTTALQALKDAHASQKLAKKQLDIARDTQELATASQKAGAATNLEIIDANTMVYASEANYLSAKLSEAMAVIELLNACGSPNPFIGPQSTD